MFNNNKTKTLDKLIELVEKEELSDEQVSVLIALKTIRHEEDMDRLNSVALSEIKGIFKGGLSVLVGIIIGGMFNK